MDPISSADRLVLILRERLLERARAASGRNEAKRPAGERQPTNIEALQALAGVDTVDDRQLGRALIQSVLSEELGGELINDAKFQQVVDRVAETLQAEPATSDLLSRVLGDLRAAAR